MASFFFCLITVHGIIFRPQFFSHFSLPHRSLSIFISQLSLFSSHLCHFFPFYSHAVFPHLSSFTEGLCASFSSLCCSRVFISAAGAPLAGCQSLLAQKPAHSSNTIHCTCIKTQPIVTARPSDWNHPISFFKYWGLNSLRNFDTSISAQKPACFIH